LAGRLGAEHLILWFRGSGGILAAGALPQFGRRLKGRSWGTRRRGHESFKAVRMIGGTGSASGAATLAAILLTGQFVQPEGRASIFVNLPLLQVSCLTPKLEKAGTSFFPHSHLPTVE
jgi:hypothetical protein